MLRLGNGTESGLIPQQAIANQFGTNSLSEKTTSKHQKEGNMEYYRVCVLLRSGTDESTKWVTFPNCSKYVFVAVLLLRLVVSSVHR